MLGKLGCKPRRIDQRTLRFARYLIPSQLPTPPASCDWSAAAKQPWGEMLNNSIGCCTCAAAGHAIQTWTANNGNEQTIPDSSVLAAYSAVSGYDPSTGANDNGAVELDVLNYWRKNGVGGHGLGAFAAVNPTSVQEMQEATFLFGGVYLGVSLPAAAQGAQVWDVPQSRFAMYRPQWQPGSWGGHAIFAQAYDDQWLQVVTWGATLLMSWNFWLAFGSEAYALISPDWVSGTKAAPSGFDMATLVNDLSVIGQPG